MKTSQYFLDDEPIQIIFLDTNHKDARTFFENGLGNAWFDYDLHLILSAKDAEPFLDLDVSDHRPPDLLLISNRCWNEETERLVRRIRADKKLASLPIFCVASCQKKINSPVPQCWDPEWRIETNCDKDARITAIPFKSYLTSKSNAQLNGIICANNLDGEISNIIDNMTANWFCSG